MALESVTHISDLNPLNPPAGDPLSQADDHLRNIKTALKTDFPNITGPVTVTQDQLNGGTWTAQTWQNVAASRAQSTTYTNSTGRPIQVSISLALTTSTASTAVATLTGGIQVWGSTATAITHFSSLSFIVPAGGTYSVAPAGGATSIGAWSELR